MRFSQLSATLVLLWRVLVLIFRDLWRTIVPAQRKSVANDIILITGGGRGIGRSLAIRFAKHRPKHIILWGRTQAALAQTAKEVQELGVNCAYMICDVCVREDIYSLAKEVEAKFGHVTMLVNNAGVVFANTILNSDPDQIEATFRTNTLAHFWTTRAFLPSMIANSKGHIVAIGSVLGLMGLSGAADYTGSKFAVAGFMDALRDELSCSGVEGVTVTTVFPYQVDNDMFAGASTRFPKIFPAISEEYLSEEIVDAVLRNKEKLIVPRSLCLSALFYRIAPVPVITTIMKFIGVHKVMKMVQEHKHARSCHSSGS